MDLNYKMIKKHLTILFLIFFISACTQRVKVDIGSELCLNSNCPSKIASENIIIEHDLFVLALNPRTKFADWVAYRVDPENLNGSYKKRFWQSDPKLSVAYAFKPSDYKGGYKTCGYDRGHQAPLASFSNSEQYVEQANYLSNITPQKFKLNRGVWKTLEEKVRALAKSTRGNVYVYTGSYYTGEPMCKLPNAKLDYTIPNGYWKIIIVKDGDSIKHASFKFKQDDKGKSHCSYSSSIEEIKQLTKINFPLIKANSSSDLMSDLGCRE
jgi:endonuclease G